MLAEMDKKERGFNYVERTQKNAFLTKKKLRTPNQGAGEEGKGHFETQGTIPRERLIHTL